MNNFNLCGGGFPAFGNHHDKPFDSEQKGLGKIFYKSDFSVWLADPTGDKTTPFTLTFYVGDLESTYTAGFDGLNYKRCKRNEDGSLLVFFDRHTLPCGRLMLRVEIDKADPDYGDGEQNTADKLPLPIILWDGATSYEPTMAYALAPYIVGADGKPFTYEDLTEEEKKDLGEKATAELAATTPAILTAADTAVMEAITTAKDGDRCIVGYGDLYDRVDGKWYFIAGWIPSRVVKATALKVGDKIKSVKINTGKAPIWAADGILCTIGGVTLEMDGTMGVVYGPEKKILYRDYWERANIAAYSAEVINKTVDSVAASMKDIDREVDGWLSFEVYNSETEIIYKKLEEKADVATTPALLTAADADAMNALTTAKDGDRCIVGGNAIYDRVGGTWYFTAGVQPPKVIKASELKAGDKIKAVNFDTSKIPAGTGDGIFCTIGGIPIEMMAFIDSLSYGTGKTPLFTGAWSLANTAACSAAMAGKTVDSVAASMAALSANVDDWLSFEIE